MTDKIQVIDYLMGTGKTTYITKYMNTNQNKRFIYITPLLSEAVKMQDNCSPILMKTPSDSETSKSENFLELLEQGTNISTTHSLFKMLREHHFKLIKSWKYTIVIDETVDFIESYNDYKKADIRDLFERGDLTVDTEKNGKVSFHWDISKGNTYANLKDMCDAGLVYSTKGPHEMLNIQVPPRMLEVADDVIVMTYMYEASFMCKFMQMHKFRTEKLVIPELELASTQVKKKIKKNIEIVKLRALDTFSERFKIGAFSHSWWENMEDKFKEDTKTIFKMCSNWLISNQEYRESFYFTCPKFLVKHKTQNKLSFLEKSNVKYFTKLLGEEIKNKQKIEGEEITETVVKM